MRQTIFLDDDIEVLVVSAGGVGTTFLIDHIGKFKKTNSSSNDDGFKHLFIPPISNNKNLKVVYLFGDPVLACISLFRRNFHASHSQMIQKFCEEKYVIPGSDTIDNYAAKGKDGFLFSEHFVNWTEKFQFYPTIFLQYESLFDCLGELSDFLELPKDFLNEFPAKNQRESNLQNISTDTAKKLQHLYSSQQPRENEFSSYFIRSGERPSIFRLLLTSDIYRRAFIHAFLKKYVVVRKLLNTLDEVIVKDFRGKDKIPGIRTIGARIKRRLLKKPYLKDPSYPGYWLNKVFGDKEAFVVQIGSNDGKTGDPLYALMHKNKEWKGLYVEPVPHLFRRLQSLYQDSNRFILENTAINDGEMMTFYWVDPDANNVLEDLPYWYDQLGSFNRQRIVDELDGILEPFIRSANLECTKLSTLLDRNNIEQIDVLHIDTEGYDWKILSQLNLTKFTPAFILYEHNHLSKDEMQSSFDFLHNDYLLFNIGIDTFAVRREIIAELGLDIERHMNKMVLNE